MKSMAEKLKGGKRKNIHFRQTAKEFRAQKQTQIFSHIYRNIPYRIYSFSRSRFVNGLQKLQTQYAKIRTRLPKKT